MIKLLQRLWRSETSLAEPKICQGSFITPKSADTLLKDPRRAGMLAQIWDQTSLSKQSFDKLYVAPIRRYAELVQELPASENHHHSYLGGMLDHGLELVLLTLKLRQSYLLPAGAPPEDQAVQADAWSAGIAYGGLHHDIGKIAVDIAVELDNGAAWHPWHGPITRPYRISYIPGRDYKLHNVTAGLLVQQILDVEILDWLSRYGELWSSFLYLLAGNYEQAGQLGEIVNKADRVSTARSIGANPEKVMQAPARSLQSSLLHGLRHLLQSELRLNQKGAAGWLTQEGLWLVSKAVSDKLRAYLLSQGFEGVPSRNSTLFDELQAHGIIDENPEGQAIWTALVVDGDWKQEFTFLKVKPSMIWPEGNLPAYFSGAVTVPGTNVNLPVVPTAQVQADAIVRNDSGSLAGNHEDDGVEDILGLFPDSPIEAVLDESESVEAGNITVSEDSAKNKPSRAGNKPQLPVPANNKELGEQFIYWLKDSICRETIHFNDAKSKLHVVEGRAFLVTPGIFQRYCNEHPDTIQSDVLKWKAVQRGFEKLKLHEKLENDLNIWTARVKGPRREAEIKGYLLDAELLFSSIPPDNLFISLTK